MLQNIKSLYFVKALFSFLDNGCKLRLIKYNKSLQNTINVSLIDYRRYSETYIIYETNEKGKEYNLYDKLIFEGEYLNGKRNGKGKEYFHNYRQDSMTLVYEYDCK